MREFNAEPTQRHVATIQQCARREKTGCKCMDRQLQVSSIVETRRADKATRNDSDSVAKCQDRTAAVCDVGLQTEQEMQRPKKAFL
jgi:hypothetical protein